jgi:Lon protease-like protein
MAPITAADLPGTIPVFPLPGALMLPRARLPLHIFEPRYLAMLDDALKTPQRLIGMVQPLDSPAKAGARLHQIGCAGRVSAFSETEDGRYMITLRGISRFRIEREVNGFAPYLKADVRWDGFERDLGAVETDAEFDRKSFLNKLRRFFSTRDLQADWDSLEQAEDELLINSLSMLCPFDIEEKQALLEAVSLSDRRQTLSALIDFALRGSSGEDTVQ